MELLSLRSQEKNLSFKDLFFVEGAIRTIIAISAYIDFKSIEKLIDFSSKYADERTRPLLRIYIDKSSSRFFSDKKTREQFSKLQARIQRRFSRESGIFLVQFGKLFHSKVYLIETNKKGKILLGSLNLTQKGISENEEILLADEYAVGGRSVASKLSKYIKEYSEQLECRSQRVSKELKVRHPSCIRQFLLNGSIYYEIKEQSPFRIKLHLPEEVIKQRAEIDPMLEASITDTITVDVLISQPRGEFTTNLPEMESTKSYWKKYCIETCYGYWSPEFWRDELASALNKRIEQRRPYYDTVIEVIKKRPDIIKSSFIGLCARIQAHLRTQGVDSWKYGEPNRAEEAWDRWRENLITKINNQEFYHRLISGISSVPAPDVWNDPISSREFEDSFFESLLYHWSKETFKKSSNVIAKAIARNMNLSDDEKNDMDTAQLKERLDGWLSKNPSSNIVHS